MILEFPPDLSEQVGSGSLVILLEVGTRQEEGWREEVRYPEGQYKLYNNKITWKTAEDHCRASEGGYLASITTEEEWRRVNDVAGKSESWIGGTDEEEEGVWMWSDKSPWVVSKWK